MRPQNHHQNDKTGQTYFIIKEIIVGNDSFRGYFGAKLAGDVVIFDNVRIGNAVYILRERWEELSKRT